MSPVPKPILGISLGTRIVGIAVIKDDRLLYWRVRKYRYSWSTMQAERIMSFVTRYALTYEVSAIAIKIPTTGCTSKGTHELVQKIQQFAKASAMQLHTYTIGELKLYLSKTSLNRKEMMRLICVRFPFLECKYQRELSNRKEYHVKMFEAILASLCLEQRIRKRISKEMP